MLKQSKFELHEIHQMQSLLVQSFVKKNVKKLQYAITTLTNINHTVKDIRTNCVHCYSDYFQSLGLILL